ncbi:formin-like protein 20 [Oryza brachyantha]|uniref:Uncharacterized protein n=1 Tax=Oryza brachyantha TaxID=4533 RepID=J3LK80_ORYBR|nr:formin-like protein 20 [Oryza brachyantha]XP_015691181.1 formin-like protein 20 [Oryza brachyantha]XP_015691182.1 formin-like protein 20 [Oryza brachyantha]
MAALVISQQRSNQQHHSSGRRRKPSSHFASPQFMRGFHAVNCRAFHSSVSSGILPSPPPPPPPPPARTYSSPEPKTPKSQPHLGKKRSRAISISPSTPPPSRPELWAGPAFSNSPPPSSLPIPKFSLHQKRSVSLDLPTANQPDDVEMPLHAKSAPSSPTAGSGVSLFSDSETAIATENLRRILHLKIADH